MGTWGPGNFENDTAAEYLINLCKPLVEQIRETAADSQQMQPDDPSSDIMLANIEILAALAENIGRYKSGWVGDMVFPFPFPKADEIEQWKVEYLRIWDQHIDGLMPSEDYKRIRRQVITASFDRLRRAAIAGPPTNAEEDS
jgi:Domain of unknown function (DUF4259)